MKRALHLVEYLTQGGIERLLEQLARHTPREKAQLSFFSYESGPDTGIGAELKKLGVPVHFYKKRRGHDFKLVRALAKVIREEKIEVLHTHDFGPMEYALEMKLRFPKLKLVHTQHTLHYFMARKRYVWFFQFASLFYPKILCVSKHVAEVLAQECPMTRKKLEVVWNGVDLESFRPQLLPSRKDGVMKMGSISRISPEKNLNAIVKVCSELKSAGVKFEWHHAGSGTNEHEEALKSEIHEAGLEQHIFLHGFMSDVRPILSQMDVFVSSSLTEGHPVSVLEAMAMGKVCVLSDIPPHRDLSGKGVFLFDLNEPGAFRARLSDVMLCKSSFSTWGKAAREQVSLRFSLPRMIENYLGHYA